MGGQSGFSVPIEVKWVSRNWRQEALVARARYSNAVLATKDVIDTSGSVWAVPAPIVALMLN